jgi:serine/threonine-protein kinase
MGEVYLAQDQKLDRRVAIKILNERVSRDDSNLKRFVREARAASALNHPNILVIHEIGESEAAHYIVSEFIEGKTLREVLTESQLSLAEVLDVAIQIAGALSAAHGARLIHRDIKPENLMVRPDGYVKVLDFGLAKLVEQESFLGLEESGARQGQTAKGVILGTVNYMSPEQAKGERVDERTDIFSLGVVIFEMIAGRIPFAGDSMSETFANLINAEPPPLSRFASNVPNELQRIVSKMLCKNKDERYQTMEDALTDLKDLRANPTREEKLERSHLIDGNAASVWLGTMGDANKNTVEAQYSFSQTIKRHKPLAAFALAALLMVSIGFGYYSFYAGKTALGADGKKSFAVLPLKPINTANRDESYEIGIADSLILKLNSIKGFIARPLSATRKYADIEQDPLAAGKEQKVDYVLASNYQLAGGKIKVTSQLFNVANGQIEGSYQSEQDAANVFAMQDAIAGDVGNKLLARFATASSGPTVNRGTTNEEAYGRYLQGRNLTFNRTPEGTRKAVEYFQQAILLDPNFAKAYSGMAHALIASGNLGGGLPRVEYEKAKEAVQKALQLDNNLAEGYAVLGELRFTYDWDFAGAEKDLLRAIELEPNSDLAHEQYASYLTARGRFDEAIAEIKTALEIDPNSLMYQLNSGRILYQARHYDEAILQLKRVIEVNEDYSLAYAWLLLAYEMKGDSAQAYEWFMKSQKRQKPELIELLRKAYLTSGWRGVRQESFELKKANEQQKPSANYFALARQCALMGDKEQAFAYLNKAIEKRQGQMIMLNVDPPFDVLRDDPRFDELVRRVGLK